MRRTRRSSNTDCEGATVKVISTFVTGERARRLVALGSAVAVRVLKHPPDEGSHAR